MKRAIPGITVTLKSVSNVFVDNLVMPYGIPTNLLMDNRLQFVLKFLAAVLVRRKSET